MPSVQTTKREGARPEEHFGSPVRKGLMYLSTQRRTAAELCIMSRTTALGVTRSVPPVNHCETSVDSCNSGAMFGIHNPSKTNYLSADQVETLLHFAKGSQFGLRDYAMVLLAYRHGLRVSELIEALLIHVDMNAMRLWVERKRGGQSGYQSLSDDEVRALKAYLAIRTDSLPWLFISMQRTRMTRQNFNYLVGQASKRAGMGKLHPHVLRDSCAHAILTDGVTKRTVDEWLGRRNLNRTKNFKKPIGLR